MLQNIGQLETFLQSFLFNFILFVFDPNLVVAVITWIYLKSTLASAILPMSNAKSQ